MSSKYVNIGRGVYKLDKFGLPVWQHNCARIAEAEYEVACANKAPGYQKRQQERDLRREHARGIVS